MSDLKIGWGTVSVGALAFLAVGFGVGTVAKDDIEATFASRSFVADRMSECGRTLRVLELSEGNSELRDLVQPDIVQCARLVSRHPDKVAERDRDTADRIAAAADSLDG